MPLDPMKGRKTNLLEIAGTAKDLYIRLYNSLQLLEYVVYLREPTHVCCGDVLCIDLANGVLTAKKAFSQ